MMTKESIHTGIIHGRFQPFHNGHLDYALQATEHCQELVVGITNPSPLLTKPDSTSAHRHTVEANPFSYYDRFRMIQTALGDVGFNNVAVIPFPINVPEELPHYLPPDGVHYTRIFEPWNRTKIEVLQQLGYEVEILCEGMPSDKIYTYTHPDLAVETHVTTGAKIREMMAAGEKWQQFVPASVRSIVQDTAGRLGDSPALQLTKQSVALVIKDDQERFLVVKRDDHDELGGFWGLPAASIRNAETLEDAAHRAASDKLGIEVTITREIGDRFDANKKIRLTVYETIVTRGEPSLTERDSSVSRYDDLTFSDDPELLRPAAQHGSLCCRVYLDSIGIEPCDV